jgi:hypothetical protein
VAKTAKKCPASHCTQAHRLHVNQAGKQLILVGGPKPYLWVGDRDGPHFATFDGPASLRELADAIRAALRRPKR